MEYQASLVAKVRTLLPGGCRRILEIGSDIDARVAEALAGSTEAFVVGSNPDGNFPGRAATHPRLALLRCDGRRLPFKNASFDAVVSVATLEHVNGLDEFFAEVARVLTPGGVFYTSFGPLWSSARGHHVFARHGAKEARFWKAGRNPIPDHAHLLMTPEELRRELGEGPCAAELIEPIIDWVYRSDAINRHFFEDYLEAFSRSELLVQSLCRGSVKAPEPEAGRALAVRYGAGRDFECAVLNVVLRKPLQSNRLQRLLFSRYVGFRRSAEIFLEAIFSVLRPGREMLVQMKRKCC